MTLSLPIAGILPDFMTPEGTVLLWSIVVFFALLAILWKFAFGPIMHALEEREKKIQDTIDSADKKMQEAQARLAEYEKKINAAKDEAAAIIAEGKRDVEALTAEEKAKTKAEIDAERERAKREITLAKDAAVAELRDRVVALTGDIAGKVIRREIKPDDHRAFIAQALNEIGSSKN
jgi:F-type H+-transporting ATPase subunit b